MRQFYLIATFCCLVFAAFSQQTVWTGAVNSDWANVGNWTNGLPVAGGNAVVPSTTNGTNWPTTTAYLSIDFVIQNSGQIFFNGNTENFNNIQNYGNGVITNNASFNNKGTLSFDNNGKFINSAQFQNYSTVNNNGTGTWENRPGSYCYNAPAGNFQSYGVFQNDGNWVNDGYFFLSNTMTNSAGMSNNKTFSIGATGKLTVGATGNFYNVGANAFTQINGLFENLGGYVENTGGMKTFPGGGKLTTTGVFQNKNVVNNAGEIVNGGTFYNGCAACDPTGITVWNEAGGIFTNNLNVLNYSTLELLQCSKFIQNPSNGSAITGKVWIMGIVYLLSGSIDQSSIMGGIVLTSLNAMPMPMAMCKPATVTLDATGNATLAASAVDNMSTYDYCTGGTITVTPASFTCANVGQNTVVLTVRDGAGNSSTCSTTVTVVGSAACTPPPCLTNATHTVSSNYVSNSANNCTPGQAYSLWLNGVVPNKSNYYQIQNGVFTENSDGTAKLTGTAVNNGDANVKWTVDLTFSGRTFTAPSGSPKTAGCYTINPSGWYYYTTTTGVLTGQGSLLGGKINISRNGPAFQVGMGANLNEANQLGASGWMTTQIVSNPNGCGYALSPNGGDLNFRISGNALTNCTPTGTGVCKGPSGGLLREFFNGISGSTVADLTGNAAFPNSPSGTEIISVFEKGSVGDNYGTRVRGFITPTTTGNYKFYVSGDDETQLFLSTNDKPESKTKIASVSGWTNWCDFYKYSTQISSSISLTAGVSYYVELLHKEGGGSDGFAVKWQKPGATCASQIPSANLASINTTCTPPPACNNSVLMVVGCDNPLSTSDQAVKNRLIALGLTVTVKLDVNVQAADATGKALVYISSSVLSTNIGTRLTGITVPILCMEPYLFDELKMTNCVAETDNGSISNVTTCKILNSTHPCAGGLSGLQTVTTTCQTAGFGKPSAGGTCVAEINGCGGKSAVFCYETGVSMCGLNAPARRVGCFFNDYTAQNCSAAGWKLFDNCVKWATGCTSLNNLSLASARKALVFDAYKKDFNVQLKWISRTGADNDRFVVERSADGITFEQLITLDGQTGDEDIQYFNEYDNQPLAGDNFYRLRLTLLDGSEFTTDAQLIHFEKENPYSIFPNPAAEAAFLDLRSLAGKSATLHFINQIGLEIRTTRLDEVSDEPTRLDLSDLQNGLYFIQVESDGTRSRSVKMMVSHLD